MYPPDSGSFDSPPEVEMLVGGNNARENQRKRPLFDGRRYL